MTDAITIKTCGGGHCWRLGKAVCPRVPTEKDPEATECELRTCERVLVEGLLWVVGELETKERPKVKDIAAKCRHYLRRVGVYK